MHTCRMLRGSSQSSNTHTFLQLHMDCVDKMELFLFGEFLEPNHIIQKWKPGKNVSFFLIQEFELPQANAKYQLRQRLQCILDFQNSQPRDFAHQDYKFRQAAFLAQSESNYLCQSNRHNAV